jgi:hypothetical protein
VTLSQNYLMLALAVVLLIANCVGAAFTIRRNRATSAAGGSGRGARALSFGWSKIYGRFAIAQGIVVVIAIAATAILLRMKF